MRMRFFCALTALLLIVTPALAESGLISALATPTPAPAGVEFARDGLRLTLPAGMELLEGEILEAYEAAVQFDYPDTATTVLVAVDSESEAALLLAEIETDADCLDAAREAAESLIGDAELAKEKQCGENRCAHFSCAIGDQTFRLYYLSDGERLLIVSASGIRQAEIEAMLAGLGFEAEEGGILP